MPSESLVYHFRLRQEILLWVLVRSARSEVIVYRHRKTHRPFYSLWCPVNHDSYQYSTSILLKVASCMNVLAFILLMFVRFSDETHRILHGCWISIAGVFLIIFIHFFTLTRSYIKIFYDLDLPNSWLLGVSSHPLISWSSSIFFYQPAAGLPLVKTPDWVPADPTEVLIAI